jgi:hypothetical protein
VEISPEFALALACCRWSFSGEGRNEIVRRSREVDWPQFIRVIRRQRVQGLVAQALRKNCVSPPAAFADVLSQEAGGIARHNLRSAAESFGLLDAFAKAGVPLLFVKGLTLSALAYGDAYVKMSADIDVLVEADAVDPAGAILAKMGYRLVVPAIEASSAALSKWHKRHKESAWHKPESGLTIELHTSLANNPALIPEIGMSSPRQDVQIGPAHSLPTLTIDDLFSYLCVHGASSAWFRLKWIVDLTALVHNNGADETVRLYSSARARNAGRAPAQALLLANRLFGLQLSDELRTDLLRDPANRLLASIAFRELLTMREPTQRPLGTVALHLTQLLLLEGWGFPLGEVKRQIEDIVHRRFLFG